MDIFGGVSAEEAAAGLTVHGEASVATYEISGGAGELTMRARFPASQLAFERTIRLDANTVQFDETVENLSAADRPIGWTQHVTLGPPFLEKGRTVFGAPATRSLVYEEDVGASGYLQPGAKFDWPDAPRRDGRTTDLRILNGAPSSAAYTTHLMDPHREHAYFTAWSPSTRVAIGYLWPVANFPWLGIWEENFSRATPPWNGKTLTRGMEFGASPIPEPRRRMLERGSLFGVPAYRWIPARAKVPVRYWAIIGQAGGSPAAVAVTGGRVAFT
jgi:hypothetical protein